MSIVIFHIDFSSQLQTSKRFKCCCVFVKRFDVARSLLTISFQCRTEVISVSMTLNIDYQQLSIDDKVELKDKIRESLAKSASVDEAEVGLWQLRFPIYYTACVIYRSNGHVDIGNPYE